MKIRNQYLKYYTAADDNGGAGGGAPAGDTDPGTPNEEPTEKDKQTDDKPSDRESDLIKEVMKKKNKINELTEQLAKFENVDLERYNTLLASEEEAKRKADEAEQARLLSEGKFDELLARKDQEHAGILQQMRDQHAQEFQAVEGKVNTMAEANKTLQAQIEQLTVGNAFANSGFIRDKLVSAFTPDRTRRLYGEHFEYENGQVIGYDRPRGVEGRTKLVDKDGHPVGFEEAISRLIHADSDVDAMLRNSAKNGAGSGTNNGTPGANNHVGSGLARIRHSLEVNR